MADKPKLEEGASAIANGDWAPGNHTVQVSIALSLKRIADMMERRQPAPRNKP